MRRGTERKVWGIVLMAGLILLGGGPAEAKKAVQDVFIFSPSELEPGGVTAFRVVVMETHSLQDSRPLGGARVEIALADKKGKTTPILTGETDALGTLSKSAHIPRLPGEGEYELVVKVSSRLGKTEKRHPITLASSLRLLLSTDKPLYQPGQVIHMRVVGLNLSDLHPAAGSTVTLTVEDPQGTKVFKKTGRADEYGIFAADFQLADEIRLGDYEVRAEAGGKEAEKTVTVKKYVLPKFKVVVDTDRSHYRPGEKLSGTVSVDYFFGKPVEAGEVKVTVQAFDVEFHTVAEVTGRTDKGGKFSFEVDLPAVFVGQPLEQGDAFVKIEAEVIDQAKHKETAVIERKVAAADLRLELVPEAGRILPEVENRIYAVVTTPDDTPVTARIRLEAAGETLTATSDDTGIAEFRLVPPRKNLVPGEEGTLVLKVEAEAEDLQGRKVKVSRELSAEAGQDTVLLRLDRAVYQAGEDMKVEVLTTFKQGSVYLDLIRHRRTVLTRALEVHDGRAGTTIALSPELFGTLEVHAYMIMPSGEIMRDTRVVYLEQAEALKIKVQLDKDTYRPGEEARLVFTVTDESGQGHPAALGLAIVDESVFAIQEMQPGLLKVYFTLEKELAQPRYEVHFSPGGETIESLLLEEERREAAREKILRVMLAGVKNPTVPAWEENPARERRDKESTRLQEYASFFLTYIASHPFLEKKKGEWHYLEGLTEKMVKEKALPENSARDSFDDWYEPAALTLLDPCLDLATVSRGIASYRLFMNYEALHRYVTEEEQSWIDKMFERGGAIEKLPEDMLERVVKKGYLEAGLAVDPWGKSYLLVRLKEPQSNPYHQLFNNYELKSAGADGLAGTEDDITDPYLFTYVPYISGLWEIWTVEKGGDGFFERFIRRMPGVGATAGTPPEMTKEEAMPMPVFAALDQGEAEKQPLRVREYFPETLWWEPALITDRNGRAELALPLADSITTWRMTALGHSADGLLGSLTAGLRVFQDFFVDIDFPVELTQGDEVEVPVAVYNYLPGSQKVTLEVREHPGFELLSEARQTLELKPAEVSVRYFRVRADKVGRHSLTVYALGSKMSDAIKRSVEVVPNGMRFEVVKNGRLTGPLSEEIEIPAEAVEEASRILVKIYPGVFAQVLEGLDGIFRMPYGCFEQTTSITYPNVMVLAYMKKTRTIQPEIQMKAESYINLGYQRLLSFEVPGGGFEWFGNPPAHPVLTAYGLMEFYDMSKVYNIDENVITRTQKWLASQQQPDGSWKPVEHWIETLSGEEFSRSVELNTAYITWALAETGEKDGAARKGINYLKAHLKDINDAYTLALALNALVAANPHDPDAREILNRLEKLVVEDPKTGTIHWEPKGKTAVYGSGKAAMIETTALILYAMIKAQTNPTLVNKGLAWLSQQKDSFGTFESTQATILAFKTLLLAQEGVPSQVTADISVSLGGRTETVKITPETADVLRLIDFKNETRPGISQVAINAPQDTGLMYQVAGIYYLPWDKIEKKEQPPLLSLELKYDRQQLKTDDLLTANVTAEYLGERATDMVILDLGIPPGFSLITDALDQIKAERLIEKYTATGRQLTIYVQRMEKGKPLRFSYQLRAKFPVKAQAPRSAAYEYYNPASRVETPPLPLEVIR